MSARKKKKKNFKIKWAKPTSPKERAIRITALFVFAVLFILGLSQLSKGRGALQNEGEAPKENTAAQWLEFDERTWKGFKILYASHNSFEKIVNSYIDGKVDTLLFYDKCVEANNYFRNSYLSFEYGENEEEKAYLAAYQSVASFDQAAAEDLLKYLDDFKTIHISDAKENFQKAHEAIASITSNRAALLAKAGLTSEQIREKVDLDMAELEAQ